MGAPESPILLYDGLCGFCDRAVRLMLRVDRQGTSRFAPLQGEVAAGLLKRHTRLRGVDSLVWVERPYSGSEVAYARSDAVLRIARHLGGGWHVVRVLGLIPRSLRDRAYDALARRRYRIFGRYEECPIPDADVRSRFLG